MAPMMLETPDCETIHSKAPPICSDPSVIPSEDASRKTKELWWLHGHPHSKRYSNPKLVSLAALVRHDAVAYQGQKAFLYPTSAVASMPYESMTWDEFDQVTETIALSYARQLRTELEEANTTREQPTIALLGGGRTLEYFCTQLALQKLGFRVLLLAESNALDAVHYLLDSCNALAVITDSKNSGVNTDGIRKLDMIEELPKLLKRSYAEVEAVKFQDFGDVWERHSFIIHSSGSTGMPKPIIHTNRSMMLIARMYRLFQEFSVENWFLLFPLYHIAGISVALSNLPNGQILSFPPLSWPPASSAIFAAWDTLSSMGHPVDCIHCAPTLIENMYEYTTDHGGDFSPLRSLKILQPGGAALSDDIVQALVAKGVNVKTTYGSTEIGPPFRSIPPTLNNPKCYTFRNLYPDNPFLKMEEVGEGLYECVVHKGFELAAELWEGKPDDEAYRTNDLFIQDPPGSGFFVLQGRKDDILVHSNGENTSAGPLQLDIQTASKIIYKALALGNSRPCVSLLVEVHAEYDPANELIQDQIWETVQQVNTRYPTHSQIMRHMIHILPKGSTLAVTPKGNVKRKEAERVYAPEIAQLYSDDSSSPLFPTSSSSSTEPLSEFLRHTLSSLSNIPVSQIEDYTTLYDLGIDSRLALSLRSSLSHHLKRSISLSTLFENPSISQLVSVFSPPTPSSSLSLPLTSPKSTSTQVIQGLISKLSAEFAFWPQRSLPSIYPPVTKETILLTGGSGSLGTALLETLTASPAVSKIYAMMRGTNHFLKLQKSLESRGMDTSILGDGNGGGKVQVLNFSMQDPLLGLGIEEYAILAKDVTVVVGNAWKMDFNAAVGEFEGDCLRNTMHLLRLCLAGRPKTFAFTSSISTCMGPGHTELSVKEEAIGEDPSVTLGTGYAQSKYIVERLLQLLPPHLSHHIPIKLLRVGQLCATGHWNTNEMWPILFATSFHPSINAIPLFLKKSVDWIPVDVAARTICEVLLAETLLNAGNAENNGGHAVHNIVNPHRISWSSLVSMLQSTKVSTGNDKMEEVTMAEWVGRLNALAEKGVDPNEVPGLRLLGFFEDMVGDEEESKVFETEKTRGISKNLRECEGMKREWIENNVRVWRESGFLI